MLSKPLSNCRLVILPSIAIVGRIDILSIFNQESIMFTEDSESENKSLIQNDSLIQGANRNDGKWLKGYESFRNSSLIINEINKQYDIMRSTSNSKWKKNHEKILRQEKLLKQKAIAQLMKKKPVVENMRESTMITFPMTKEKFDSIPDNLMIRKLVLDYKYDMENRIDESMDGKSRFKLLSQQKVAIIIGAVLCVIVTIIIGVLLIVIHNTADAET